MELFVNRIESPLGKMLLVTDGQGMVRALRFSGIEPRDAIETDTVKMIAAKLERYFAGDLGTLDDIAVAADGSDFQRQIWAALRKIPAGKTTTYGELARYFGHADPRMAKEIGAAIGANPIAIIVPCHRVIGKDGTLKGYAWGLQRKRRLLVHEGERV
jgi:methylated-DNA-[protein]-cysteine S-methyltransferase